MSEWKSEWRKDFETYLVKRAAQPRRAKLFLVPSIPKPKPVRKPSPLKVVSIGRKRRDPSLPSRQLAWQRQNQERGNCRQCCRPRDGNSISLCETCRKDATEAQRRYVAKHLPVHQDIA